MIDQQKHRHINKLAHKYASTKDVSIRNEIISITLPLIYSVSQKNIQRCPTYGMDKDDLAQEIVILAVDIIEKYCKKRNFMKYYCYRLFLDSFDYLRKNSLYGRRNKKEKHKRTSKEQLYQQKRDVQHILDHTIPYCHIIDYQSQDSEHSYLYDCLNNEDKQFVDDIYNNNNNITEAGAKLGLTCYDANIRFHDILKKLRLYNSDLLG